MLGVADRQQGLFDAAWCSDLLPEGSIYALLAEHGDRIIRDEDFQVAAEVALLDQRPAPRTERLHTTGMTVIPAA
jgi:hypothetical protein